MGESPGAAACQGNDGVSVLPMSLCYAGSSLLLRVLLRACSRSRDAYATCNECAEERKGAAENEWLNVIVKSHWEKVVISRDG